MTAEPTITLADLTAVAEQVARAALAAATARPRVPAAATRPSTPTTPRPAPAPKRPPTVADLTARQRQHLEICVHEAGHAVAGVVLGIIGFFVIPVVGLFLGFVAGVFLSESARRRTSALTPWQDTVQALKAVGTNILIEILAGLLIIGVWIASLVLPALV